MNTNERLKRFVAYLKSKGIVSSQEDFGKKLGYNNRTSFSRLMNSDISEKFLDLVQTLFPDFATFDNSALLQNGIIPLDKEKPVDSVIPQPYDGYMEVEFADLSTAAGKLGGNSLTELPRSRKMLVPKEFDNGNYLVVRVEGDSMDNDSKGSIPNGTDILIKEYFIQNGDKLPIKNNLFVIVSREGTVLKKITEHNIEEGFILCHSYNPAYKDYPIPLEDILQIFIFRKIVGFRPPILD